MDNTHFLAWMAAFIEGEGTIHINNVKTGSAQITVYQKDISLLKEIQKRVGGYLRESTMDNLTYRKLGRLSWSGECARELARLVRPYMLGNTKKAASIDLLNDNSPKETHYISRPNDLKKLQAYR